MRVLFELISELLYFPILKSEDAKSGEENSRFTFCVQNAGDSGLLTHPRRMEYKRIWTCWSTHQIGPKNHIWDVFQSTKTAWQLWHLVFSIGHDLPIDTKVWLWWKLAKGNYAGKCLAKDWIHTSSLQHPCHYKVSIWNLCQCKRPSPNNSDRL